MLWEVDIFPADGQPDRAARQVAADAADLGIARDLQVASAAGYLIQGDFKPGEIVRLAHELLADPVTERAVVGQIGDRQLADGPFPRSDGPLRRIVNVLPKPGVMD